MTMASITLFINVLFAMIVNGVKVKQRFDHVEIRKTIVRMAIPQQVTKLFKLLNYNNSSH